LLLSAAAAALATAMSGPVAAADLPLKAERRVMPAALCVWCGWYAGGHIGYGWSKFEGETAVGSTPDIATGSLKPSGLAVGLHVGYNWQSGNWVYGFEGDGTITPWEKDDRWDPAGSGRPDRRSWNARLDWLASIRARLGYSFGRSMIFVTGGAGFGAGTARIEERDTHLFANFRAVTGVVGGGFEHKVWQNASVRVEGLHYFFDKHSSEVFSSGRVQSASFDMKGVTVIRAGASWHFNP
jgi:outer membrane immunogenic protein